MTFIEKVKDYFFKLLTGRDYQSIDFEQMEVDTSSAEVSRVYTLDNNDKD